MHINEEVLEKYALQTLVDQEEVERIEEHLLICEECQQSLDDTTDFVQAISGAALESRQTQSGPTLTGSAGTNRQALVGRN